MAETQKLVTITGRVQMVGFRFFAVRQAQRHAICGYVRNRYDGSVEVLAQGEERDLSRFLSTLKKGPPSAEVEQVTVEDVHPITRTYHSFDITF